jgi:molybdopterin/thiamine biosynthesis adenylyltransferase
MSEDYEIFSGEIIDYANETILITEGSLIRLIKKSLKGFTLQVATSGGSQAWVLELNLEWQNKNSLPKIKLADPLLLLAHVSWDRTVCIDNEQGLSLDAGRKTAIFAHTLTDALTVLEQAYQDRQSGYPQLLDEFEGYWNNYSALPKIRSTVTPEEIGKKIWACIDCKNRRSFISCFRDKKSTNDEPVEIKTFCQGLTEHSAIFLPCQSHILPPPPQSLITADFINDIVSKCLDAESVKIWAKYYSARNNNQAHLLLSQPRPSGGLSLFALSFSIKGMAIIENTIKLQQIIRHTTDYIKERGCADQNLDGKHIAVIGCGSIGSEIVDMLVYSGMGSLTLIDHDTFEVDNIYRHRLTREYIGVPKSLALKGHYEKYYPVKIEAVCSTADKWVATGDLSNVDCAVVAIGSPVIERNLFDQIRDAAPGLPLIFTWLEPLGLGGHVVCFRPDGSPGCLHCLYKDDDGRPSLSSRVSFIEPSQPISRDLTGCGGSFAPYSSLYSKKTALLASEICTRLLTKGVETSYSYWFGDPGEALKNGIKTSRWYSMAPTLAANEASARLFSSCGRPCQSSKMAKSSNLKIFTTRNDRPTGRSLT